MLLASHVTYTKSITVLISAAKRLENISKISQCLISQTEESMGTWRNGQPLKSQLTKKQHAKMSTLT